MVSHAGSVSETLDQIIGWHAYAVRHVAIAREHRVDAKFRSRKFGEQQLRSAGAHGVFQYEGRSAHDAEPLDGSGSEASPLLATNRPGAGNQCILSATR